MIFNELNYLSTRWKVGAKVKYLEPMSGSTALPPMRIANKGIITNIFLKDTFPIKVKWDVGYENRYNVRNLKLN